MASFSALPAELHVRIALAAGTRSVLRRCSDLLALVRLNRHFYQLLSPRANPLLWATVFAAKFDAGRIDARLGPRWSAPPCRVAELRKRFAALDRIRAKDVLGPYARDDAWTAYLMLMEDDGLNGEQLLDGAHVREWVYTALVTRQALPPPAPGQPACWLADNGGVALLVWLLWYVVDDGTPSLPPPLLFPTHVTQPISRTGRRIPTRQTSPPRYALSAAHRRLPPPLVPRARHAPRPPALPRRAPPPVRLRALSHLHHAYTLRP